MQAMNPIDGSRRRLIRRTALVLAGLSVFRAGLASEALDGAQPFEIHDFGWYDSARARPVPTRLYLPLGHHDPVRRRSPLPLVVFSHGLGGSRTGYRYLSSFLASQGFACLHPQHVGSDRSLWAGGSPFSLVDRLLAASRDEEAVQRVMDLSFSLDQISQSRFSESIDAGRIVVAGHSYGANSALLIGGAQVMREGKPVVLHDARAKAIIALSAPPFYGETSPAAILRPMTLPSLHITCTEDTIRIPTLVSGPEDRLAIFEASGGLPKCLAMFEGGSHSVFTDREATGGFETNRRIKLATCNLVQAFLALVFHREKAPLLGWKAQHESALRQFVWR